VYFYRTKFPHIKAVITADIVNSTRLTKPKEKKLLKRLETLLAAHRLEFYRGDSFQALLNEPGQALGIALLCRTAAVMESDADNDFDVRVSIGIGSVATAVKTLSTAKGEAFMFSGRGLDELYKSEKRLCIITPNPLANAGLDVIADYVNHIFKTMTSKQAAVLFELLQGQSQQVVAHKLKKSKSTVHQHVTAGRWPELEKLLHQYGTIVNFLG
jgi:hypothetical protein